MFLQMFYSQDPKVGNVAILPLASVSSTTVTQHVAEDGNMLWGWDVTRAIPYCIPSSLLLILIFYLFCFYDFL